MKQITLANRLGRNKQHVTDVKVGRSHFGSKTAVMAEQITGISRMKWLWPDEYGDPFIELKSVPENCNTG